MVSAVLHSAKAFWFGTRLTLGAVLIAAGLALAIVAVRSFRRAGTNVEPWKPTLSLVTSGFFGWMRNPMYMAIIMFLAGLAIALGSDPMLVLVVPAAVILHFGAVLSGEEIRRELSILYEQSATLLDMSGGTFAENMIPRSRARSPPLPTAASMLCSCMLCSWQTRV
jgi:protein-S-isoprenylcysteine O-methyltransferase Ste14